MSILYYPERKQPRPLARNVGLCYNGWNITLDLLWSATPQDGYLPVLGGKEINAHPTQSPHKYAKIVRDKPGLTGALQGLQRCLVTSVVSKHVCFAFQPAHGRIFGNHLHVLPTESYATFAVLNSNTFASWAWRLGSTKISHTSPDMTSLCYTSAVWDTFPFPDPNPDLAHIGHEYYQARAAHMVEHNIGLTVFYNSPPDWHRSLRSRLDRAVLAAYGWQDLDPSDAMGIFNRLYKLNQDRARI